MENDEGNMRELPGTTGGDIVDLEEEKKESGGEANGGKWRFTHSQQ